MASESPIRGHSPLQVYRIPGPAAERLLRRTVSAITSAVNPSGWRDTTVRQMPFTAILSPIPVPSRTFFARIEMVRNCRIRQASGSALSLLRFL